MGNQQVGASRFETINQMLEELRGGFEADGYELRLDSVDDACAAVTIVAGPEACPECLVPKSAMEGIVMQSLSGSGIERVTLTYPTEIAGQGSTH